MNKRAIFSILLLFCGSSVYADQVRLAKSENGTVVLEAQGGDAAFYIYKWLTYATQKQYPDRRRNVIRTASYYLNSYSAPDGMSFINSVKLFFDGKKNTISVTGRQVTFSGQIAFLMTQGAVVANAIEPGSIIFNADKAYGQFQVTPSDYRELMCERVGLPADGERRLVNDQARCLLNL